MQHVGDALVGEHAIEHAIAFAQGIGARGRSGITGAQDKVDENFNRASQVRISVTSSVKTP